MTGKMFWMKQSQQENLIYLVVWGLLFLAPLLSLYVRTVSTPNLVFDWTEVFIVWQILALFLVLFLAHNFLLAPLLIHQQKRVAYFAAVAVVMIVFTFFQCSSHPERRAPMGHRPPPMEEPFEPHRPPHRDPLPPPIVGEHDILAIVVLLLMFGANLGIKSYFRSHEDRKRLETLEKQHLEQQLAYLRYQINPHFFMNTLNNIHALVDIDPAKAQDTILELSKMMRFVLYEGEKSGVPLSKEMAFIRTYVRLMQLRYTDKVRITIDLPDEAPDCTLPPLMLISFIENAFKHGVSYQHESFIEIRVTIEENTLRFSCRNSKADVPNQEKGGVGLANVRKRLNLLYGNAYSLHISNNPDVYTVQLTIPLLS